jgi:ribosome-associated heat shock protein Hsp15
MKRNDIPAPEPPQTGRQRLDKWLWVARFYKTRSLAAQAVEKGHVKVRGERVKPAHPLRPGEQVSLRRHGLAWSVDVLAFSDRRGSAAHAAELYRETPQSLAVREQALVERKAARAAEPGLTARPTKRDRRKLEDFLNEP